MKDITSVCKDCTERTSTCHTYCEQYKEFRKKQEDIYEIRRMASRKKRDISAVNEKCNKRIRSYRNNGRSF